MKDEAKNITYIFWTGGWDSTYRIVELSRQAVTVQPVYCLTHNRRSTSLELQHMEDIINALTIKPKTKATFLPIKKIDINTLQKNIVIENAFQEITKHNPLGTQYIPLAKIAKQYPGIELGLEKPNGEFSSAITTIDKFGKLININGCLMLDKDHTTSSCYALFGNMSFPICHITERDMLCNIKTWGYEDIMKLIWFCHTPLRENDEWKSCGICRPCQQKMECHMEFLLSMSAQKRYRKWKYFSRYLGAVKARLFLRIFHFWKVKDFLNKGK